MSDLYFNNRKLPSPKKEYVAFIDLMGTKNRMLRSVSDTSNFIFKLHAAIVSSWRKTAYHGVFVYPIMDGVYITSVNKENMEKLLGKIYLDLSGIFIDEENIFYKFIPRCGLAYGEVIHGHNVPFEASKVFELDLGYKNNILLGQAMINAYESEREAAPFGVHLHESAIKNIDDPSRYGAFSREWVWYKTTTIKIPEQRHQQLGNALVNYFQLVKAENHPLHYETDRIVVHESRVKQYFALTSEEEI